MTPDDYREAIKEIAAWLEPIRSHETNSTPYKRIIEARRIADRALASTTAALPPPESGSSGLGSAAALEVEAGNAAWLVERGQSEQQVPTVWWIGDPDARSRDGERWTQNAYEATRFIRQMEAQEIVERLFTGPGRDVTARVTEHIWLASATKPEASPSPENKDLGDEQSSSSVEVPPCGVDSELHEDFDATAGGKQFYVVCSCGHETPERLTEAEAWRDHDDHAWPVSTTTAEPSPSPSSSRPVSTDEEEGE